MEQYQLQCILVIASWIIDIYNDINVVTYNEIDV